MRWAAASNAPWRMTSSSPSGARNSACRRCCSTCSPAWAPTASSRAGIGRAAAEKLILSGKIHTAAGDAGMGLVDVLAEDGEGEAALLAHLDRNGRWHNAHQAMYRARRKVDPVTLQRVARCGRGLGRGGAAAVGAGPAPDGAAVRRAGPPARRRRLMRRPVASPRGDAAPSRTCAAAPRRAASQRLARPVRLPWATCSGGGRS